MHASATVQNLLFDDGLQRKPFGAVTRSVTDPRNALCPLARARTVFTLPDVEMELAPRAPETRRARNPMRYLYRWNLPSGFCWLEDLEPLWQRHGFVAADLEDACDFEESSGHVWRSRQFSGLRRPLVFGGTIVLANGHGPSVFVRSRSDAPVLTLHPLGELLGQDAICLITPLAPHVATPRQTVPADEPFFARELQLT